MSFTEFSNYVVSHPAIIHISILYYSSLSYDIKISAV